MLRTETIHAIYTIVAAYVLICTDAVIARDVYACSNATVPGICNCVNETRGVKVNCDSLQLKSLPKGIPHTTIGLTLRRNNLTEMDNLLADMKNLQSLDVTDNQISKPFYLPRSLRELCLNRNRLTEFGDMLSGMENLETLRIDENDFTDIPAGTLKDCKQLEVLQARKNKLKGIRRDMFYGMGSSVPATSRTVIIDLSHMSTLSYIEENAFVDIGSKLEIIDVSSCNITEVPHDLFLSCTGLQYIELNNNKITELPQALFKNISNRCEIMNLNNNKIKTLPPYIFRGISYIGDLFLHGNQLEELPEDLLLNTTVLRSVDISGNGLKWISPNFFHGRLPRTVFMYSNKLDILPKELFKSEDCGLRELYIFNNEIKTIEDNAFLNCRGLETVFAFSNQLTNITIKTFLTKGSKIKDLNIIQNPITYVENGAFDTLDPAAKAYMSCEYVTQMSAFTSNSMQVICVQPSTMKHLAFKIEVARTIGLGMNGHGFECRYVNYDRAICKPCELGFYSEGKDIDPADDGSIICKVAPRGGFYQDKIGQVRIEKCNPGTFVLKGAGKSIADCKVCPSGTNTSRFADYRACFCLENFHRTNRFGECLLCNQTGIQCTQEYQHLKAGYWWSWDAPALDKHAYRQFTENIIIMDDTYDANTTQYIGVLPIPYACLNPDACIGSSWDSVSASCAEGYSTEYPMCSVCANGYYKLSIKCKKCPQLYVSILIYLGLTIGISLIISSVYFYRKKINQEGRTVADVILARLKICIGFYQVLGGLLEALRKVRWPSGLVNLGNIINFIELNFVHIVSPRCIYEQFHVNAYVEFYMAIGIPLLISFVITLTYHIRKTCYKRSNTETCETKSKIFKKECFKVAVLILFTMYPTMCSKTFALLPPSCRTLCKYQNQKPDDCPRFLKNDYTISCNDDGYVIHKILSTIMAIIVAGILPIALLGLLMKVRPTKNMMNNLQEQDGRHDNAANTTRSESNSQHQVESSELEEITELQSLENNDQRAQETADDSVLKYGLRFLYENYKDNCWYWEILELVRKLLLTSVILFFGAESKMQIGFAMVSSIVFLLLHGSFQPMKNKLEYWLQVISLGAIAANLSIGILLLVPDGETAPGVDTYQDSLAINIFMYVVNGWILLIVIGAYLVSVGRSCVALFKHPQCSCECCIAFILPTQHFISRLEHCGMPDNSRHIQTPPTFGSLKPRKSYCPCWCDESETDTNDDERERLIRNRTI